ncbi:MAG: 2-oxo acid dehydrogenase subunit E2 [Dehalococcoidia bacterium]|nr:2-oxo acid dehydrogenase subunit E2 [Dehalococcoidia bacterium]
MAVEVVLPLLGLGEEKGTIVRWVKSEGDRVEKGDVLFEVETEKVVTEVESPASGILRKILVTEGVEVPVSTVVAVITAIDEELPEKYLIEIAVPEAVSKPPISTEAVGKSRELIEKKPEREVKATPLVRKLAKEYGIDLSLVSGTGPEGRIVREDVLRAVEESKAGVAAAKPPAEMEEKVVPLSPMRKTIARRMVESFQSAPHFYLTIEVDTKELEEVRQQLMPLVEEKVGIRLTMTDLLIKVVAKALEDCPDVNCSYVDGSVRLFPQIDIGVVVAVEGGLIVPVIRQADKLSLQQITKVRAELVDKARERRISRDEMTGSTFTISNLGMFGIDQFSAILQPPEAAILAIGRVIDKPVVLDGEIVIRPRMILTLSIDHRVLDGVSGSRFLQRVKELIEKPTLLHLEINSD